ncbi:endonuclease/exonuclease/phosphatase family protein [Pseudoalteromonas sp. H105]|uniref:endonuclease/exonuclease/phosphatase family protein n=1 Tax=Pseudoalteromonas sp. H105 TaxID=1348393 RepID=UPI000B143990|nr:endonuclease/exonuclease/phosphatase family protein [Pseudoalteromonas sp. H105]
MLCIVFIGCAYLPFDSYFGDLITSLRMPLLVLTFVCGLLLLLMNVKKIALGILAACIAGLLTLLPSPSWTTSLSAEMLSIKQINLNYNNPHIAKQLAALKNQSWDMLVLQEYSDLNRHLLRPFLTQADLFGYREVEGIPYGIVVISRLPIVYRQQVKLDGDRLGFIKLRLLFKDTVITTYIAHPPSPRTKQHWQNRNYLLAAMREALLSEKTPWLVIGDLNVVPWSYYFDFGTASSCYTQANAYVSFTPFRFFDSLFTGLPIDHCIFSDEFSLENLSVTSFEGSDHKMLSYQLSLNKS